MYPSTGLQIVSALVHFLGTHLLFSSHFRAQKCSSRTGVSVLSHCLSRRLAAVNVTTWRGLSQLSWPRLCTILVFIDSWLFLCSSEHISFFYNISLIPISYLGGILIFGVGLEQTALTCSLAIYSCIAFYATSKLLIYSFLSRSIDTLARLHLPILSIS
jgi:hypothetical protein